jgi:hypothetical protein
MKVVRGDLVKLALDGSFEVIIDGCNCQCAMGAGIAKAIKQAFSEAYHADKATGKGSRTKLGSLSTVTVERGAAGSQLSTAILSFAGEDRGAGGLPYSAFGNAAGEGDVFW